MRFQGRLHDVDFLRVGFFFFLVLLAELLDICDMRYILWRSSHSCCRAECSARSVGNKTQLINGDKGLVGGWVTAGEVSGGGNRGVRGRGVEGYHL